MIAANKLPKGCENRPPQSLAGIGLTITLRQRAATPTYERQAQKNEGFLRNLHHFDHYHYRRDDDGQEDYHHPKKEPQKSRRFLLFGGFVLYDHLRITQRVGVVDWLLLGLVGDCEAVVSGRGREGALLCLDLDGLAVKQRSKGHHGTIDHRRKRNEGVDGVRLDGHQLGTAFRYATDATLSAALRVTGAQYHRHRQHQEENKDSRLHGLQVFNHLLQLSVFKVELCDLGR